jgi:DNA-binding transcriptional ArsR family regulator
MGITKAETYSNEQISIATLLKALGHPARVAIVEFILSVDSCICGDIVNELPLAQPTVSQHLKELKKAGLIKGMVEGNAICYCLDQKAIDQLKNYFSIFSIHLTEKNCC